MIQDGGAGSFYQIEGKVILHGYGEEDESGNHSEMTENILNGFVMLKFQKFSPAQSSGGILMIFGNSIKTTIITSPMNPNNRY
ncbi:MAG: hypothetical protein ACTSUE_21400 [Promethearchaeota archaeon]